MSEELDSAGIAAAQAQAHEIGVSPGEAMQVIKIVVAYFAVARRPTNSGESATVAVLTPEEGMAFGRAFELLRKTNLRSDGDAANMLNALRLRLEPQPPALRESEHGGEGWQDAELICWAMCVGAGRWEAWGDGRGEFCMNGLRHSTKLDAHGVPEMTGAMRDAILRAKDTC